MSSPLPSNLTSLVEQFPLDIREKIIAGWSHPRAIVSFRVNYLKSSRDEVIVELEKAGLPYSVWEFWDDAFILPKEHEYALRGLDIYRT